MSDQLTLAQVKKTATSFQICEAEKALVRHLSSGSSLADETAKSLVEGFGQIPQYAKEYAETERRYAAGRPNYVAWAIGLVHACWSARLISIARSGQAVKDTFLDYADEPIIRHAISLYAIDYIRIALAEWRGCPRVSVVGESMWLEA